MMPVSVRRVATAIVLAIAATVQMPQVSAVANLPGHIVLRSGSAETLPASSMLKAQIVEADSSVAALRRDNGEALQLQALSSGEAQLTYSLLGVLPVRTVNVSVEDERRLIPGGQSVGVAINTAGVMVIGTSDLGKSPSPVRVAGLRNGDVIRRVNGVAVNSSEALSSLIHSSEAVELEVERAGKVRTCTVEPALDSRDGCWRLGAWVRDSTAGVGTLTYYDPATGGYGALGHAITDADTRVLMPLGLGELYANRVLDVTPSQSGRPGELTGDFVFDARSIGTVEINSDRGIFGGMTAPVSNGLYPDGLPIAARREIHTGPATLLATVDESGLREFGCEIVRVNDREAGTRAMVLRVTDPELMEKTGGIVQGMSGSPVIQEGRLIGAVTHVMVNDPAMGYGISIEDMLEEAEKLGQRGASAGEAAA